MTQEIRDGLNHVFDMIIPLAEGFEEKTYAEEFPKLCEEIKPLINKIEEEYDKAEDQEAFLEEVSSVIPDRMNALLADFKTKRQKEGFILSYNLGVSTYVIPAFREFHSRIMEEMVDLMVRKWNDNGLSLQVQKSTYSDISGGFKARLCYITTAVCDSLGKGDDCYELNLLREYRDGYLKEQPEGEKIIDEYYDIAPTIVKRIDRLDDSKSVYENIWKEYLEPCIHLIESGKNRECGEKYMDMVISLRDKYLYS